MKSQQVSRAALFRNGNLYSDGVKISHLENCHLHLIRYRFKSSVEVNWHVLYNEGNKASFVWDGRNFVLGFNTSRKYRVETFKHVKLACPILLYIENNYFQPFLKHVWHDPNGRIIFY